VLDADTFAPASGVLTVGLLDEDVPTGRILAPGCVAQKLDDDGDGGVGGCVRYMLPAPDHRLALLAEFNLAEAHETELLPRIDVLMASFRWAE
jgi:hypothetical protein